MGNEPLVYATFWKRFNAYGWDSLCILGMTLLVQITPAFGADDTAQQIQTLVDAGLLPQGTNEGNLLSHAFSGSLSFRDVLMPMVLAAVYNIAFVGGEWQATPGKRFSGIKVIMADGSPLNYWQAAWRHLASGVSTTMLYLGFLPILWTKERTALHDMMCGTRVIIGKN